MGKIRTLSISLLSIMIIASSSSALAGIKKSDAGGICPHQSTVETSPGQLIATTWPTFTRGWTKNQCKTIRIKVRAKNVHGYPAGWRTLTVYGTNAIVNAEKFAWTKHDVKFLRDGRWRWSGFTIWQ